MPSGRYVVVAWWPTMHGHQQQEQIMATDSLVAARTRAEVVLDLAVSPPAGAFVKDTARDEIVCRAGAPEPQSDE